MRKPVRHVLLPSIAPLLVFALWLTPKSVFGCANRGLLAAAVALLSAGGTVFSMAKGGASLRRAEREAALWWLLTALILLLPLALLVGPLG
jgi:hypothetical protein